MTVVYMIRNNDEILAICTSKTKRNIALKSYETSKISYTSTESYKLDQIFDLKPFHTELNKSKLVKDE